MNKNLAWVLTLIMIAYAASRIYNAYFNYHERTTSPAESSAAERLAQYPVEAQNFNLTRACQAMQAPLLLEKGVAPDQVAPSSLPICTCISTKVKESPEFDKIEARAKETKDFLKVITEFQDIFVPAMNLCGK